MSSEQVSATAATSIKAAESATLKTFQVDSKTWGAGHDMNTFMGRYRYFLEVASPEKSMIANSTILQYKKNVQRILQSQTNDKGQALLSQAAYDEYRAQRIVMASSVHPDTGDIIPWPTRISSFVPTNVPIVVGMLLAKSLPGTFFWQWAN